jgi:hypothetical protein
MPDDARPIVRRIASTPFVEISYHGGGRELRKDTSASSKDLGVIVTVLELAARSLTTKPGTKFTLEQLIHEAHRLSDVQLDQKDLQIVLKVYQHKSQFSQKADCGPLLSALSTQRHTLIGLSLPTRHESFPNTELPPVIPKPIAAH